MSSLLIMEVKILMLIKWFYGSPPILLTIKPKNDYQTLSM